MSRESVSTSPQRVRRKRKEDLSLFESELARPADYGDFMGVDAPVSMRNATKEVVDPTLRTRSENLPNTLQPPDISPTSTPQSPYVSPDVYPTTTEQTPVNYPTTTPQPPDTRSAEVIEAKEIHPTVALQQPDKGPTPDISPTSTLQTLEDRPSPPEIYPTTTLQSPGTGPTNHPTQKLSRAGFYAITGVKRKILIEVFLATKGGKDRVSSPIAVQNLIVATGASRKTVETTLSRLVREDGHIKIFDSKAGRGGWVMYEISEQINTEMVRAEMKGTLYLTPGAIRPTTTLPSTLPNASSSSSFNKEEDFLRTTTSEQSELSSLWYEIDCSPLESIGFRITHLLQIARKGALEPSVVQDSINAFSFDLRANNRAKNINKTPLEYFLGILIKGMPYNPPDNYLTPEQEAMKLFLEKKKALAEKRKAELHELYSVEINTWKDSLTEEQIKNICPEYSSSDVHIVKGFLMTHFDEHVWPKILEQAKQITK